MLGGDSVRRIGDLCVEFAEHALTIVGLEGTARSCLLLGSVMPSAVINFIFAEKFASEPGDVATAVVASTLVSVVTTPLVLAFGL